MGTTGTGLMVLSGKQKNHVVRPRGFRSFLKQTDPMLSVPLLEDMQDRRTVKYIPDPLRNKGWFYIRCCDLVNIDPAQLFPVIRHSL